MRPLRLVATLWLAAGLAVGGFGLSAHLSPASADVSCDGHHHCGHDDEDHHHDTSTETVYRDHYNDRTETRYQTETVTEDRTHERTVTENHTETVHDGSHSTHCSGLVSACDVATVTVDAQHLIQQTQSQGH